MIKNKCILLVEDSDSDRLLYGKYLNQLGYEIRTFDNCESLLEILSTISASIILLDIELPGINGLEAARIIRKSSNSQDDSHVLIAISAHNDSEMLNEFVAVGFDDYLQKPFMKRDLEAKVAKYFSNQKEECKMNGKVADQNLNGKLYNLDMFEGEDSEFISSIIQLFLTNTPVSLELINSSHLAGDMEALRQHAHKLKPHFLFFGASDIQQTMQKIEDIARYSEGKELLPELIDCVVTKSNLIMAQMKDDFKL